MGATQEERAQEAWLSHYPPAKGPGRQPQTLRAGPEEGKYVGVKEGTPLSL